MHVFGTYKFHEVFHSLSPCLLHVFLRTHLVALGYRVVTVKRVEWLILSTPQRSFFIWTLLITHYRFLWCLFVPAVSPLPLCVMMMMLMMMLPWTCRARRVAARLTETTNVVLVACCVVRQTCLTSRWPQPCVCQHLLTAPINTVFLLMSCQDPFIVSTKEKTVLYRMFQNE
jgi:hypothetical protein